MSVLAGIQPLMVWHDQFKTAVLANAASEDWNDGVMVKWRDAPSGWPPNRPPLQQSIAPFFAGGVVEIDLNLANSEGVNIYAKRGDEPDFTFLARDTASPYIDNRPLLVATKPELREYKCLYVLNDEEIRLFSDEVVVNCAP